jgi:hypothetical protein
MASDGYDVESTESADDRRLLLVAFGLLVLALVAALALTAWTLLSAA